MSHLLSPESAVETMRAIIAGRPAYQGVDVCVRSQKILYIGAQNQQIVDMSQSTSTEIGLRLRQNDKVFCAATSHLDVDNLRELLRTCERNIERLPPTEPCPTIYGLLFEGDPKNGVSVDKNFNLIPLDEKMNRVINMGSSPSKVNGLKGETEILNSYKECHQEEWLWTQGSPRYLYSASCYGELNSEVLAKFKNHHIRLKSVRGDSQYYNLPWSDHSLHVTQTANKLLDGKTLKTGEYKIVIEKSVMAQLVAIIGKWFMADRVLQGKSVLSQSAQNFQLSPLITLVDDPSQKKGLGPKAWDHEGTPTQRKVLLENGSFRGLLHNLETSAKLKDGSKGGNAYKALTCSHPTVKYHNLMLEPGNVDFVDLVREMQDGIVVYGIRGLDSIHPVSGSFNFKLLGVRVENGTETYATKDVLLRGNLIDLFSKILKLGRDMFSCDNVSAPSALISSASIVGGYSD